MAGKPSFEEALSKRKARRLVHSGLLDREVYTLVHNYLLAIVGRCRL